MYIGSTISHNGDSGVDVTISITKASAVFQQLWPIWTLSTISILTKIHLYMSIVAPTATYGSETWKKTVKIAHQLDVFLQRCLWNFLRTMWRDRVMNKEVLWGSGQADEWQCDSEKIVVGRSCVTSASAMTNEGHHELDTWWRQVCERVAQDDMA